MTRQKSQLHKTLWDIANALRGNMGADEFWDYIQGTAVKVSPEGKILKEIELKGKKVSNIAFGAKEGTTAFVTLQDRGYIESF